MSIVVGNYVAKPQPNPHVKPAEAIQLTADNIEQVAEWCDGFVKTIRFADKEDEEGLDLSVFSGARTNPSRQTAYLGNWIVRDENGFKVYNQSGFDYDFQPAPETDPNIQAIIEIGEEVVKSVAVRSAITKAVFKAYGLGRRSYRPEMTDNRLNLEMGVLTQTAIAEIMKIFRVED